MPFARNDPFEMLIQVEADHFNVTVNGRHQFDYRHRVPLNQITRFGIDGQVDIHGVTYVGVSFQSLILRINYYLNSFQTHQRAHEIHNPVNIINESNKKKLKFHIYLKLFQPTPSAIRIPGGLVPGKLIQIIGQTPHYAGRFDINLQQSGHLPYAPNIGLHFNPRWDNPNSPQPVVVCTHSLNSDWEPEEEHYPSFPFAKGTQFELLILFEPGEFKVAVNGQHFISFPHRMPFKLNDHLSFNGDVQVSVVRIF